MTIAILSIAGAAVVGYIPYNPFAWILFALVIGLMAAIVMKSKG